MAKIKITKQEALQRVYDALQPTATPKDISGRLGPLLDRARRNRIGNQTTSPVKD